MKIRDVADFDIALGQMENAFSVHKDRGGYYFFNLLEKIHMPANEPESYFDYYEVKYEDQWPTIAYSVYGDVKLWWLITLANKISNPTTPPTAGTKIKIYKVNVAREIIGQIQ